MTENRGHSGRRARARSAAVRYQAVCSPVQNDPNREPSAISFNEEAAKKWLANGAQPTEIVAKLLKQAGIEK